jgi:hypothetical protein
LKISQTKSSNRFIFNLQFLIFFKFHKHFICLNLQTIDNLKQVYDSVDDIDLYIGCLSESSKPVNGSVLGPTAVCVIAKQFSIIKNNDRYFYDVTNQINSLTTGKATIIVSWLEFRLFPFSF